MDIYIKQMINAGKFLASCFEVYSLTHVHVVNKLNKIDVLDTSQTDIYQFSCH